jgi:glucosamine--fructose-6-phosphate aminotransferase (isomerizing)
MEAIMSSDLSFIEGEYLRDILNQPQALEDTLASLESPKGLLHLAKRLNAGSFHRIVLTGMGSSFYALHPLCLDLIGHGFCAMMVETSELVHYKSRFFDPKTLIVAVSQSGHSAEMIRLIEVNQKRAAIIAVTNTPESPLALQSDAAVLTMAGDEVSVSCKTYVTALIALKWLSHVLCEGDTRHIRRELKEVVPAVVAYLANWKAHVRTLMPKLNKIRHLFLVGRGVSLAAAGTGALIVKEADHFHAEGMSSAAFRHGPFEMLGDETFVLVFSGDARTRDLNIRLLADILEQGSRAELCGEDASSLAFRFPDLSAGIRPILEIMPVQMITLALAAQARREPGRFELATKVTITE